MNRVLVQVMSGAFGAFMLGIFVGRYGVRLWRAGLTTWSVLGLVALGVFVASLAKIDRASQPWTVFAFPLAVALVSFIWSFRRERRMGWKPFRMTSNRHTDIAHGFSVGIPHGWRQMELNSDDTHKGYVAQFGTPDKQAMLSVGCARSIGDFDQWRGEKMADFEELRQQFADPTMMKTPEFRHLPYGAIDGELDVMYARFVAYRGEGPSICDERFVLKRGEIGYVIDHFVTSESDADIGAILSTWKFLPTASQSVVGAG